jgi:chemotaxis protein CheZ
MKDGGTKSADGAAPLLASIEALIATGGDAVSADQRLFAEVARLALLIQQAKQEIAALGASEIGGRFIPEAKDELDAVVGATEAAADAILSAAETIESEAAGLAAAAAAPIRAAVTRIYEACNFQDITGQRIGKVVRTLQHIEARVLRLLGPIDDTPPAVAAEAPRLENGPQLAGAAHGQAEIDAIFGAQG